MCVIVPDISSVCVCGADSQNSVCVWPALTAPHLRYIGEPGVRLCVFASVHI